MPAKINWTPEMDAIILAKEKNGHTWYELGRLLKISQNPIVERARRLGIKPDARIAEAQSNRRNMR
jgi:hypothetical protein